MLAPRGLRQMITADDGIGEPDGDDPEGSDPGIA
jgi:hypothetical protein